MSSNNNNNGELCKENKEVCVALTLCTSSTLTVRSVSAMGTQYRVIFADEEKSLMITTPPTYNTSNTTSVTKVINWSYPNLIPLHVVRAIKEILFITICNDD